VCGYMRVLCEARNVGKVDECVRLIVVSLFSRPMRRIVGLVEKKWCCGKSIRYPNRRSTIVGIEACRNVEGKYSDFCMWKEDSGQ